LKGTSHSFPQSAQVALCISLLLYIRYFNSYYFGCAKGLFHTVTSNLSSMLINGVLLES